MEKSLNRIYTPAEAKALGILTLAWIGDGVFSDLIRRYLVNRGIQHVNHLTKRSVQYVSAKAQAKMIHGLIPLLSEEEQDLVRRGRNSKSTPPKNADPLDYRYATGMEALWGYLALTGNTPRLLDLTQQGIRIIESM